MGDYHVCVGISQTYRHTFIGVYISLIKQGKQAQNGITANGELCAPHTMAA
jgi:hypothetical protein